MRVAARSDMAGSEVHRYMAAVLSAPSQPDYAQIRRDVKNKAIQVTPITLGPLPKDLVRALMTRRSSMMEQTGVQNLDGFSLDINVSRLQQQQRSSLSATLSAALPTVGLAARTHSASNTTESQTIGDVAPSTTNVGPTMSRTASGSVVPVTGGAGPRHSIEVQRTSSGGEMEATRPHDSSSGGRVKQRRRIARVYSTADAGVEAVETTPHGSPSEEDAAPREISTLHELLTQRALDMATHHTQPTCPPPEGQRGATAPLDNATMNGSPSVPTLAQPLGVDDGSACGTPVVWSYGMRPTTPPIPIPLPMPKYCFQGTAIGHQCCTAACEQGGMPAAAPTEVDGLVGVACNGTCSTCTSPPESQGQGDYSMLPMMGDAALAAMGVGPAKGGAPGQEEEEDGGMLLATQPHSPDGAS